MATTQSVPQRPYKLPVTEEESTPPRTLGQFVLNNGGNAGPHESLGTVLGEVVARLRGEDPAEGDFCLYDHLDPDALNAMYDHAQRHDGVSWQLDVDIGEETIIVQSDGYLRLAR